MCWVPGGRTGKHPRAWFVLVVVVQSLSHVLVFATPPTFTCQASLSFTVSWSLLKSMSIESVMLSNHLILCYPLSLLAFNLSQHEGLFHCASSLHQVAKILGLQPQHQSLVGKTQTFGGISLKSVQTINVTSVVSQVLPTTAWWECDLVSEMKKLWLWTGIM